MGAPTLFERRWPGVILTPISVANSVVTVSSTLGLRVKMKITLRKAGQEPLDLEIKRVLNDTDIKVGPIDKDIALYANPVAYNGGSLESLEQKRNEIDGITALRNAYDEEPAVALRTVPVDRRGQYYSTDNPMPVILSDGSINIGTVNAELEVQLSHLDGYPNVGDVHDSIRIGGRANGPEMVVNPDGSINVSMSGLNPNDPGSIKKAIMCAPDVELDFTWAEIDGVRRITQIIYSSALVATALSKTSASVQRDFTYMGSDPFDLTVRQDLLILVP